MNQQELIKWLLEGDVAIQYQAQRDLMGKDRKALQRRIASEGWGARYLAARNPTGHWGQRYYQPKWISSHYTLLDLRNLCFPPNHPTVKSTIELILDTCIGSDGGINPAVTYGKSDVCVNGMFLNFASYFKTKARDLHSIVDFILSQLMPDGGFNCRSNRAKPVHSSLHTTLSILEGITSYEKEGYDYRLKDLQAVKSTSIEFLLLHQLYLSDRTGKIINKDFLRLAYPGRWRYDILRALDYLQWEGVSWDDRLTSAIEVLQQKRNKNGTWNINAKWPGQQHFEMEKAGRPSRWNTLRALRVLEQVESFRRKEERVSPLLR